MPASERSPETMAGGPKTVVVSGASSGVGALTVRALGRAGHTVYAAMRQTETRNAQAVADRDRTAH